MGGAIGFESQVGPRLDLLVFAAVRGGRAVRSGRREPAQAVCGTAGPGRRRKRDQPDDRCRDQLVDLGLDVSGGRQRPRGSQTPRESAATQAHYSFALVGYRASRDLTKEEFAAAVNSTPELGKPTLMLLTPLGVAQDLQRLRNLGFAECVTKPIMQIVPARRPVGGRQHDGTEKTASALGPQGRAASRRHSAHARKGSRILLAEDNEINQQVAVEVLDACRLPMRRRRRRPAGVRGR